MELKPWEVWAWKPEVEGTLADRARGKLPEMESTKQLVKLVSEVYEPGMTVLDAGCNAGHYLVGLRRLDPDLKYTGIDAYAAYIDKAKEIFADDPNARFEIKSVFDPLYPDEPFNITYSCNVILHLNDFRPPVKNILESTKSVCFIRTLLSDEDSTVVLRASGHELDDDGRPVRYTHQNTWQKSLFAGYIESLGWKCEFIEDEFDASVLAEEYTSVKKGSGTRIVDGKQVDGNIIFNWVWTKITRP